MTPTGYSAQGLREAAERAISSRAFRRAERSKAFLRFIADQVADGKADRIKEYVIAVEVFGRSSYDPKVDSVVRVEASKLRGLLASYYDDEGREDPLRIEIPKGGYVPRVSASGTSGASNPTSAFVENLDLAGADAAAPPTSAAAQNSGADSTVTRRRPEAATGVGLRRLLWVGATLSLFMGGLVFSSFRETDGSPSPPRTTSQPALAVLPVVDLSDPKAPPPTVDALTGDLLAAVQRLDTVRLPAWVSVTGQDRGAADVRGLGSALGVHAVLESTLRLTPDRLRLAVALVDARDGLQLWSDEFSEPIGDGGLAAARERIANEVAQVLPLLGGVLRALTRPHSTNPAAYQHYLRAAVLLKVGSGDPGEAVDLLRAATTADPAYALAWAALSSTLSQQIHWGFGRRSELAGQAEAAAQRALRLAPGLAESHQAIGRIHALLRRDVRTAELAFLRGLELDPASIDLRQDYAQLVLTPSGRLQEARQQLERGLVIDRHHQAVRIYLAQVLARLGELDQAEQRLRELENESPGAPGVLVRLGTLRASRGRFDEAVAYFERAAASIRSKWVLGHLGWGLGQLGRVEEARRVLEELQRPHVPDSLVAQAAVLLALSEVDAAFEALERAEAEQSTDLFGISADSRFRDLHRVPRFRQMVARVEGPEALRGL